MVNKSRKITNNPGVEKELRAAEQGGRYTQVPILESDPESPPDGFVWIRRATYVLCVRVEGVTRIAALT